MSRTGHASSSCYGIVMKLLIFIVNELMHAQNSTEENYQFPLAFFLSGLVSTRRTVLYRMYG